MEKKNGTDYAQNYDLVVRWLADVLRGETLDVIGVKSGQIEEIFGFEPAEIKVTSGRVDVMVRDDTGSLYHIEEQRNLKKKDMWRFAAYHFLGGGQWGGKVTDIILASGEVWSGENGNREITTPSGKYSPVIIDFSQRDGRKRLMEIREAVGKEDFGNWLELVFLPLYGKEKGTSRSRFAEEVLRFEAELYKAERISARLLAATLIISNKLIDKERLRGLWEEIRMLDIIEIAREEGMKEGKTLGILEDRQEMITDALIERFGAPPARILEKIRSVQHPDVLRGLFRHLLRCESLQEFEAALRQAT
ncbi:Uncharacterized protein dnm_008720 [Desulfonema magnum]|uniref:DUF4351 domain-containing protein n=1 Tax=Desulfonema magnum TaxID=45655 RepID=A0A975GKL7_9BACT|nr:Uncharacterized protein dnm_008720 [Desulfonema magnum]